MVETGKPSDNLRCSNGSDLTRSANISSTLFANEKVGIMANRAEPAHADCELELNRIGCGFDDASAALVDIASALAYIDRGVRGMFMDRCLGVPCGDSLGVSGRPVLFDGLLAGLGSRGLRSMCAREEDVYSYELDD